MPRVATMVVAMLVPASAMADGVFQIGAGYGVDEGFIAETSISNDNLFHSGQKLAMTASISKLHQRFAVDYSIPLGDGLDLTTQLFSDRRQLPGFVREAAGGSIGFSQRIDRATRVYINYRLEHVAADFGDSVLARTTGPIGPIIPDANTLATVGAGIVRDTTDGAIPRRGTKVELSAEASDTHLGSDVNMYRASALFAHAHTFGGFLTLRGSARVGKVGGDVPITERLYHAGNADIRGYGFGTPDSGASFQAIGRLEAEVPLVAGVAIGGFFDAGIADQTVRRSVGASIIWRSPIGPLRFDWARPLDSNDKTPQFMFSFGGGF